MKNAKQPNADGVARPMLQTATRMMMMTFVNKVEFQGQQHHFYFPVLGSWLAKEVSRADAAVRITKAGQRSSGGCHRLQGD